MTSTQADNAAGRSATAVGCGADPARTRGPGAQFDAEIAQATAKERRIAWSALIALALVGLVVLARFVFFGF